MEFFRGMNGDVATITISCCTLYSVQYARYFGRVTASRAVPVVSILGLGSTCTDHRSSRVTYEPYDLKVCLLRNNGTLCNPNEDDVQMRRQDEHNLQLG